jgi:CheY-like chemotaxis protein
VQIYECHFAARGRISRGRNSKALLMSIVSSEPQRSSSDAKAPATEKNAGVDRRRRRRAKITAQVHIRATDSDSSRAFQEICASVDVSRDGLLFTANRSGYWRGQRLHIVFPYSSSPGALNQEQIAEVVRVQELPGKKFAVAVHFFDARLDSRGERKGASPYEKDNLAANVLSGYDAVRHQSIILAVEPDQKAADDMRDLLQQDGYVVITVPSANEALAVLRTTIPSAFIAEVETEGISGHDFCAIIKRDDRLQHVPVILLTRSAKPGDFTTSNQMGAVVCMAKPFKPERLQQVVRLVAPPPTAQTAYGARLSGAGLERTL